jgi:hypothetical protein
MAQTVEDAIIEVGPKARYANVRFYGCLFVGVGPALFVDCDFVECVMTVNGDQRYERCTWDEVEK